MLSIVGGVLALLLVLGLALYVIGLYNSFIALDRTLAREFSNMESVMKQRHDELPKLVDACRAYMTHERTVLENVIRLRGGFDQAPDTEHKVRAENALNRNLGKVRAVAEGYPDLKAGAQFQVINGRITALETVLADRREQFNQAVTHYNIFIGEFPALLVAALFRWRRKTLLEVPAADRSDDFHMSPEA